MSSFRLNSDVIKKIYEKIIKFKPEFLYAYPSNCYSLGKLMEKNKLNYRFKGIFCSSEKLFDFQREFIEDFFNCRIISWYGHSEYCVLAGECEKSNYYHVFPEYGYTEFIKAGNNKNMFEIVATGFNNYVMPFIRYKTGDFAVLTDEKCRCGRNYKLIKEIIGREQDYIITKNKQKISLTALIFGQHYEAFSMIERLQLIQEGIGTVTFIIKSVDDKYNDKIKHELSKKIFDMIGKELNVYVNFDSSFRTSRTGKIPFFIQELKEKLIETNNPEL